MDAEIQKALDFLSVKTGYNVVANEKRRDAA
jgi:hypothetical protein